MSSSTETGETPTPGLEPFIGSLAKQIRQQEKKRFWRLVVVTTALTLVMGYLLFRIQTNDMMLRQELVRQCQARNAVLEAQREEWRALAVEADPEERYIWVRVLTSTPPGVNCEEYFLKSRR